MIDERAGVATSDHTIRMTDSICKAADNPKVHEITATILSDSDNVLIELWDNDGRVVGQYLVVEDSAWRLRGKLKSNARREPIIL